MVSYPLGDFATVPLVTAPLRALIPRQAQRAAVIPTVSNTVSVSLHIDERAGRQHEKGDSDERPTHQGDRRTTSIVLVGRAVHASLLEPIHQEGALRDLCQRQASVDLERCLRGRAKHFRKACPHVVACGMGIGPATIKPSVPFFVWVPCGGSRKRRTDCCRRPGSRTPHTPRRSSAKRGLQSRFVQNGRWTTACGPVSVQRQPVSRAAVGGIRIGCIVVSEVKSEAFSIRTQLHRACGKATDVRMLGEVAMAAVRLLLTVEPS